MTGTIILIVLVVLLVAIAIAFFCGKRSGKKAEQAVQKEAELQKAKDAADYEQAKKEIMQEAFGNAEQKKAELSTGTTPRERFDAINDSLRNSSTKN
jgi:uncharacterized protein YpmB